MTNTPEHQAEILQDRYGLKIAARLSDACDDLPYEVAERLRAARTRAVSVRRLARPQTEVRPLIHGDGTLALGGREDSLPWWGRLASILPVVTLVIGLFLVNAVQNEYRAQEVAEVDAALLTDDLPPVAYADPGFVQFLKTSTSESARVE